MHRSEALLDKHPHLFPNYLQPSKLGIIGTAPPINDNIHSPLSPQSQYTVSPRNSLPHTPILPKPPLQRHQSMVYYDKYSTPFTYSVNNEGGQGNHARTTSEQPNRQNQTHAPIYSQLHQPPTHLIQQQRSTTNELKSPRNFTHTVPIGDRMRYVLLTIL